jgi:predicted peroxiredoxin
MRKTLTAAALALAAFVAPAQAEEAPDLVTILTSEEPQTQLMSMVLTMQSMKQGANTHILLCGPGGDLALKEAPESATAPQKPKGMSPQKLMQMIIDQGGTVEVCAIYLPNKDVGADALIDGVSAAKPQPMAKRLLGENTRIMSF